MSEAPKPPAPIDVRNALVEDYVKTVRESGGDVAIGDIERIAQEDLRVYEAVERERKESAQPKPSTRDERVDTAALKATELGMALARTPIDDKKKPRRDPLLDMDPRKISTRFPAAMARIKRIFEARGNTRQMTLAKSLEEVAAPTLARKFMSLCVFWKAPDLKMKANPFYGVGSARDRARIMIRKIEDICDESTGAMGPWWVK